MGDTSKRCEAEIGQTLPPPYPGGEQDVKPPPYQGGVQEGTRIPANTGGMQEVSSVGIVQTQTVIRVINHPDPPIETFFICSIFVMIFCCLPFGIIALVHSCQQRSFEAVGDFDGARKASRQAKCWSYTGFFTGLFVTIGIVIWVFLSNPYY